MKSGRKHSYIPKIFRIDSSVESCSKLCTLRARILGWTLLLFGVALAVTIFGMWTYHHERLLEMTQNEAVQAGLTVEAGLRNSMLMNDRQSIQSTIDEMIRVTKLSRIHILDNGGRVVFSSNSELLGTKFDKESDSACVDCHKGNEKKTLRKSMLIKDSEGPFWRNVIKVENRPACHECHPAEQKLCGVMIVDASLADMYSILRSATKRLLLTGFLTFVVIAVVLSLVVNRFVLNPLSILREGFGRVGKGEFDHWVDIKGCGELADMGDSFNIMSRAIGRYIQEIGRKTSEFEILYAIVQKISKTIELRRVMEIVVNILHDVVQAGSVLLVVVDERDNKRFELTWRKDSEGRCYWADYNLEDNDFPYDSVCCEDLQEWQAEPFDAPRYRDQDNRVILPLNLKNMRLGMVCIIKEEGDRFTHAEKNLFPSLAQHIAISLANARLYNQAITDELTSLYTKRHLFVKANDLIKETEMGSSKGFCLLMLDLDHFKEINDTYGHPVGDQVLKSIGELIWIGVRHTDIPCRYGGEEFAILLPDVNLDEASLIAERLLKYISGYKFFVDKNNFIHKTTSIGIAEYSSHAANVDELVAAADAALYNAKRHGRNQVKIYDGPAS